MKRLLRPALGCLLVAGLLYKVASAPGVDLAGTVRSCQAGWLATAAAVYALGYPLMVLRWRMLLEVQDVRLSWWIMLRLVLVGNFFNLLVPGSIGGDVAKAAVLSGRSEGRRVEALLTIVLDRVLGLLGLLILAFTAVMIAGPSQRGSVRVIAYGLGVLASTGLVGMAALATWPRWRGTAFAHWLLRTLPARVVGVLGRILQALDLYRTQPLVLARALCCSVGVHATGTMVVILLARAVGEQHVGIASYFLAVQVANVVASIPLTPGGVGGRDYVLFRLLTEAGADTARAATVPILYTAMVAAWAILGGVVYLFTPTPEDKRS